MAAHGRWALLPQAKVTLTLGLYHGDSRGPLLGTQWHLQAPCPGHAGVISASSLYPPSSTHLINSALPSTSSLGLVSYYTAVYSWYV